MIYFIQEVRLFRGRVKIGFTENFKGRLAQLRSHSPSPLKVLLTLPGGLQTELSYHERFDRYRLHGEWFSYGLKLKFFVWVNQFKPFVVDLPIRVENDLKKEPETKSDPKPQPEAPPTEPTAETETESISVANWPQPAAKPTGPTADEMAIIEAVKQVELDNGKVVWSQVTSLLGWTATGPNNQRIKAVLDKYSEEMAAIEAFVMLRDNGEFSWNKAAQAAFGEGKVGKNYHDKLKRILTKFNIDYSELAPPSPTDTECA